jgi:hypothetical protein
MLINGIIKEMPSNSSDADINNSTKNIKISFLLNLTEFKKIFFIKLIIFYTLNF